MLKFVRFSIFLNFLSGFEPSVLTLTVIFETARQNCRSWLYDRSVTHFESEHFGTNANISALRGVGAFLQHTCILTLIMFVFLLTPETLNPAQIMFIY